VIDEVKSASRQRVAQATQPRAREAQRGESSCRRVRRSPLERASDAHARRPANVILQLPSVLSEDGVLRMMRNTVYSDNIVLEKALDAVRLLLPASVLARQYRPAARFLFCAQRCRARRVA